MNQENEQGQATRAASNWGSLCRTGGIAALILIVYSLATIVQVLVVGAGRPAAAADVFSMLQNHRIEALLRLDLPTVIVMPVYYLLFLGLFAALRRTDLANTILATSLVFVGLTLVLATPTALPLISLSERYGAATTEATRTQLVAAGEAILAADIWHGTGAIMGGILLQAGAVLISVVMLRSNVFSKATAYVGLVTHGLDLAHIVFGIFLPAAGAILLAIAGPLYLVWFPLVGWRLFQLAANDTVHQNSAPA